VNWSSLREVFGIGGSGMTSQIVFYDWAPSPFCIKVRAILDYKKLTYKRVNPLGRAIFDLRRRGKTGKVPAVEIGGRLVVDSTDIAYELEKLFPEPPVLPGDAKARALCHALEDWCDESLYFSNLYYQWHEAEGRKNLSKAFGTSVVGRLFQARYSRVIRRQLKGQGTLRKTPEHVRADLERHVGAIEALLAPGPFLLGAKPYLCDFALLGQLIYLGRTPVGAKLLEGRAGIDAFRSAMKAVQGR
jgi:glutathione S-transferase